MHVIKRDGKEVEFNKDKIAKAVKKACNSVNVKISEDGLDNIVYAVVGVCSSYNRTVTVEEIQDIVEEELMNSNLYTVARAYIKYRYERELNRKGSVLDRKILSLVDGVNKEVLEENSNKNPLRAPTQRDYIAGEVSRDMTYRLLLDKDIREADKSGEIHFHDPDYFIQKIHNCCLVNLKDMYENNTVITNVLIETPKKFSTACNIGTQIVAQVASSQYGGQSISLEHLAPFVDATRRKFREKYKYLEKRLGKEMFDRFIEDMLDENIRDGVQTLQYQILTLMTTNGQTPFVTLYMDINEAEEGQEREDMVRVIKEVLRQRLQGVKNEKGVYVTPAFPKIIYVLDENNYKRGTEYWEVTELALKCSAKRMVPDYISAKKMREYKEGNVYPCMGCRSFLTPYRDENGEYKFYGRFNQGVVTVNLPYVGLKAKEIAFNEDREVEEVFWEEFDKTLELCYRALMIRHNRLKGTKSSIAPILWEHGAIARLKKGETIDKLLLNGYSTLSLGYAGLNECVQAVVEDRLTSETGKEFGKRVMQYMNDKCSEWREKTTIAFSLYGTPIESTTYTFAKALQNRFGVVEGVSDKPYVTNSYHVPVYEEIDAFSKLDFEGELQPLSPGGAISYVEVPDLTFNMEALEALAIQVYDHTVYAEFNSKSDYCLECGFEGEIQQIEEGSNLVWECPNCKNRDLNKMVVTRRTCGYLGQNWWNAGRTREIFDRVMHL